MSHFSVLVACQLPDGLLAQDRPAHHQCTAPGLPEEVPTYFGPWMAAIVKFNGGLQLKNIVSQQVESLLAPYGLETADPDAAEFINVEHSERLKYATGTTGCVRMPDGRLLPYTGPELYGLYGTYEGKIYQCSAGQLHHWKRTKRAKRMKELQNIPIKRLYPTFLTYIVSKGYPYDEKEQAFGYYTNPNIKWDWYQIGGGWSHDFLVRQSCLAVISRDLDLFQDGRDADTPTGCRWVSGARKCDIEWDLMKQRLIKIRSQSFHQLKTYFDAGKLPDDAYGVKITEEGIFDQYGPVYRKGEPLEDYLCRMGLDDNMVYPYNAYAFLDQDGWRSMGEINCVGLSGNEKDAQAWKREIQSFIASLSDDTFLVTVDCHY